MSKTTIFWGAAAALAMAGASQAQTAAPAASSATAPAPGAPAATAGAPAAAPGTPAPVPTDAFKPGIEVKDSAGATVGTIVRAGTASNGVTAVVVNVDGKEVSLPANLFTMSGDNISTLATKAQIEAAIPKG